MTGPSGPAARLLVLAITGYQRYLSPALGQHCRFAPSCSSYAVQAVTEHGAARGSWLAARRLLRCHPWNPGGHDPVPSPVAASATMGALASRVHQAADHPHLNRTAPS